LKRTIAEDALVEPEPGVEPLSTTVTSHPRRASSSAIELPMMPAPTTIADEGAVVTETPTWVWGWDAPEITSPLSRFAEPC
jgi:hypothetical protein